MKAIILNRYGSPDGLQLAEVATPIPSDHEVRIRVHAASVNEWDWAMVRGVPLVNRVESGLLKPRQQILGADVAGRVEATGPGVTRLRPGDDVLLDLCGRRDGKVPGYGWGAFAEYVCVPEHIPVRKPGRLSFEQAATLPQAGALAIQGLGLCARIRPGQRVLINGASGGVGSLAVQIAASLGGDVTGVCSAPKMAFVRSLGAARALDYSRTNFTQGEDDYDVILDVMGLHSVFECRRALSAGGCYVMLGGASRQVIKAMAFGPLLSRLDDRTMRVLLYRPNVGLDRLLDYVESGRVKPVIDRTYSLKETADALRYYRNGLAKGKVVIRIA